MPTTKIHVAYPEWKRVAERAPASPSPDLRSLRARPYFDCLRQDAAFHGFVAAYAMAVPLVGTAVGAPHKVLPLAFFVGAAKFLPLVLLLVLAGTGLWSLRSSTPLRAWRINLTTVFNHHALAGALLFLTLCVFMGVFSSMKQMLTDIIPFFADRYLADLDGFLHGRDPWLLTSAAMPQQLMPALEGLYLGCWGLVLMAQCSQRCLCPRCARCARNTSGPT